MLKEVTVKIKNKTISFKIEKGKLNLLATDDPFLFDGFYNGIRYALITIYEVLQNLFSNIPENHVEFEKGIDKNGISVRLEGEEVIIYYETKLETRNLTEYVTNSFIILDKNSGVIYDKDNALIGPIILSTLPKEDKDLIINDLGISINIQYNLYSEKVKNNFKYFIEENLSNIVDNIKIDDNKEINWLGNHVDNVSQFGSGFEYLYKYLPRLFQAKYENVLYLKPLVYNPLHPLLYSNLWNILFDCVTGLGAATTPLDLNQLSYIHLKNLNLIIV